MSSANKFTVEFDSTAEKLYKAWLRKLQPKVRRTVERKVDALAVNPFGWSGGRKHSLGGDRQGFMSMTPLMGCELLYKVNEEAKKVFVLEFNMYHYQKRDSLD